MDRATLIKLPLYAFILTLIARRWLAYRRGVRAGTQRRSRTFERSGRAARWGLGLMLVFGVLLPVRQGMGWPKILFYLFFGLFLLGGALLLLSAVLYGASASEVNVPPVSGRAPDA
jgi:hypothetical protein